MSNDVSLDWKRVAQAADAADDIYKDAATTDFVYWRTIEQFRLAGELAAAVRFADGGQQTAIVAIRGTSLLGNWLFTNFQAYFRSFNVVDESLTDAPSTPYQGGTYKTPVYGSLHQGFYRAFSWLWYGTEPILGHTQGDRSVGFARLRRYLTLFALVPALLVLVFGSAAAALTTGLVIAFAFVTLESGVWEDVFRDHPKVEGEAPFRLVEELNKCDRVVFTGHSLGGSIAAIAYCLYRRWCMSSPLRRDNAVLVTFGAPRIGDEELVDKFRELHRGRYLHVVHPGDPVPELPPNGLKELWFRRFWRRGHLGVCVVLLYPFWFIVALLYRNKRAARWTDEAFIQIEPATDDTLRFSNHSMSGVYRPWAHKMAKMQDLQAPAQDARQEALSDVELHSRPDAGTS